MGSRDTGPPSPETTARNGKAREADSCGKETNVRRSLKFISTSLAGTAILCCLLLTIPSASFGADTIENPGTCNVCGMDRAATPGAGC